MKQFILLGVIIIYSHTSFSQSIFSFPERKSIPDIYYFDNSSRQLNDFPFIKTDSIVTISTQGSKFKVLFEYNGNGKLAAYTILFLDGVYWLNDIRDTLLYDSEGKLSGVLDLGWSTDGWDSLASLSYFYQEEHLSFSIYQTYNQTAWENVTRDNYEYTDEGYLKSTRVEQWLNTQWENWIQWTCYYSDSEFRDSTLFEKWENDHWRNDEKIFFYYGSNNIDVDSIYGKIWNSTSWSNLLRRYIMNDNNHNQVEQLDEDWDGNSYYNVGKYLYSYNESSYVLSGNALLWDNGNWIQGDAPLIVNNPDFPYGSPRIGFITNYLYGYYSNATAVEDNMHLNDPGYKLSDNYPNPFNPATTIEYSVSEHSSVTIKIFDILSREIETLVNEEKPSGTYKITWNAKALPSGVYFCRMQAGGYIQTKKMILMK